MINDKDRIASDLEKYRSMMSSSDSLSHLEFCEDSKISHPRNSEDGLSVDWIYIIQNMIVSKMFHHFVANTPQIRVDSLFDRQKKKFWCVDVGSQIEFISVLASMANYVIVDPSIQPPGNAITVEPGMVFVSQEAQDLDLE